MDKVRSNEEKKALRVNCDKNVASNTHFKNENNKANRLYSIVKEYFTFGNKTKFIRLYKNLDI